MTETLHLLRVEARDGETILIAHGLQVEILGASENRVEGRGKRIGGGGGGGLGRPESHERKLADDSVTSDRITSSDSRTDFAEGRLKSAIAKEFAREFSLLYPYDLLKRSLGRCIPRTFLAIPGRGDAEGTDCTSNRKE